MMLLGLNNCRALMQMAARLPVLLFFLTAGAVAADSGTSIDQMRVDQLVKEADYLLNNGDEDSAIPYLDAYLDRMKDVDDSRVREMKQDIRFKLASIFLRTENYVRGDGYLNDYVKSRPAPQWHEAMKLRVSSLLESRDFEACVVAATNAMAGPPADVRAALEKASRTLAAETDPDAYEFDEFGELIIREDNEEGAEPAEADPSGYSVEDLVLLNMALGQAYTELGRVMESLEPFSYVVKYMDDPIRKGYAIMQVVNGLVEKKDFKALTTWVPELYRTEARYDIRVNMALINAATALFDAKEYDSALPLFRMILPRNELIDHQSIRLRELQIEAGIIAPDAQVATPVKVSAKDSLFGKSYGVEEETFVERGGDDVDKPEELLELERLIETIKTLPPYENEAIYRNAYLYDEVHRPWEAVRFFDRIYREAPSSDLGIRSFYEVIRLLLNPLKELGEAESRGLEYLANKNEGLVPRQVAYLLCGFYQQNQLMEKVKSLLPVIEGFVPEDRPIIRKYECELYYMQAIADLMMMEYELAEASFRKLLVDFSGSHQEENATYWHATTLLYLQRFEDGLLEFQAYLNKYPNGTWVASAVFQSGTCQFGLEKFEEAKQLFTQVIEQHSDSPVYPDACNLRGDIYGSEALLDEAILDYVNAFAKASNPSQAKYATFQMAKVYEAESRYDEIIRVVNGYLDVYGDQADVAEGIFWIGKTKVNQGRIDEAVQSYFGAIVEYGGELEATGVDSMIDGLVRLSQTRLNDPQRTALKNNLVREQKATDSLTLSLRLRAVVAQMDGTEIELGRTLINELPDLENAAPPVLAAICDASFESQDYSRAEEILRVFIRKFSESEFMRPAFKLRGYDLFNREEYSEALTLIAEAQSRYGTDYDAAWAQIMKGQCLAQLEQLEEALEALTAVLNVNGWRGESYAEATYRLGQTEEAAGNLLKAHGWYQRTYVQYKGYADGMWAADGYLGSARCLTQLGYREQAHNTYRAMLFDKYVNQLPQALDAKQRVGPQQTRDIAEMISSGVITNFTVTLRVEEGE